MFAKPETQIFARGHVSRVDTQLGNVRRRAVSRFAHGWPSITCRRRAVLDVVGMGMLVETYKTDPSHAVAFFSLCKHSKNTRKRRPQFCQTCALSWQGLPPLRCLECTNTLLKEVTWSQNATTVYTSSRTYKLFESSHHG